MFRTFLIAAGALLLASCETVGGTGGQTASGKCVDGGMYFCLTAESWVEEKGSFDENSSKLYHVRTSYTNYYIYEGRRANVSNKVKEQLKPFSRSRQKAEYAVFERDGYYQAFIRRTNNTSRPEMHIWTESRTSGPEEIEAILERLRLF